MNHLLIGAPQAAHIREYARSYEQATAAAPRVCSWADLMEPVLLPPPPAGALIIRAATPVPEEVEALETLGGAPAQAATVEKAPAALVGLVRVLSALEQHLPAARHATPPRSMALLLDLDLRRRCLQSDAVPLSQAWPLSTLGAHLAYEALRDRLRHASGQRVLVRLRRSLNPIGTHAPSVILWSGGRGLRAQANCQFTALGAERCPVYPIEDEAVLRPLLGRLLEIGAVAEEDWPSAEIGGRPFVLTLLVTAGRVVLGHVGEGGVWRVRFAPPEAGVPRELAALRRQIPRELYERIEATCVRLCQQYRCAALLVDVALSRRFDDFCVLDLDPFAEVPGEKRDAVGWSGYDHLVRQVRALPEMEAPQAASG